MQVLSPPSATSATALVQVRWVDSWEASPLAIWESVQTSELSFGLYGNLEAEHSQIAPSREGKGLVTFLLVVLNHRFFNTVTH